MQKVAVFVFLALASIGCVIGFFSTRSRVCLTLDKEVLHSGDQVSVLAEGRGYIVVLRVNPDSGVDIIGADRNKVAKVDMIPVNGQDGPTIYVAFARDEPRIWNGEEFARLAPNDDRANELAWSRSFGVPAKVVVCDSYADFGDDIELDALLRLAKSALKRKKQTTLSAISKRLATWNESDINDDALFGMVTVHTAAGAQHEAIKLLEGRLHTEEKVIEAKIAISCVLIMERRLTDAISQLKAAIDNPGIRSRNDLLSFTRLRLCETLIAANRPEEAIEIGVDVLERPIESYRADDWALLQKLIWAFDDCGRYDESLRLARRFADAKSLPPSLAMQVSHVLVDGGWEGDVESVSNIPRKMLRAPHLTAMDQRIESVPRVRTITHACAYANRGASFVMQGDFESAKQCLEDSLEFMKDIGYHGALRAGVETSLAEVLLSIGPSSEAVEVALTAIKREKYGAYSTPTRLGRSFLCLSAAYFRINEVDNASKALGKASELQNHMKMGRAKLVAAEIASLGTHLATNPEERQRCLDQMIEHASREVEQTGHPRFMADEAWVRLGQYLAMAEGEDAQIYRRIAAFAARSADAKPPWDRDGTALLDVIHYHHLDDYFGIVNGSCRMHYAAFLTLPDGTVRRIELGEARPIDDAIRQWREAMSGRQPSASHAEQLDELFWSKIRAHWPDSCRELYLCADWELGAAPWEALPMADNRQLIDHCIVRRLPSSRSRRLLARYQKVKSVEAPADKGTTLLIGDLDYGRSRATKPGIPGWLPLPGAAEELQAIRKVAGARVTSLEGTQATKQRVLQQLVGAERVHFATHGFANAHWGPPRPSLLDTFEQGFGVALSRANELGVDATLTVADIGRLQLPRLQLAVLSGCETGIGQPDRQLFLSTLHRAFHQAGATQVVATMWQVDDWATQALIERFYAHYFGSHRGDPAAALRSAQLDLRDHPEAFRPATGDGRAPNFAGGPQPLTQSRQRPQLRAPLWTWGGWYASCVEFSRSAAHNGQLDSPGGPKSGAVASGRQTPAAVSP